MVGDGSGMRGPIRSPHRPIRAAGSPSSEDRRRGRQRSARQPRGLKAILPPAAPRAGRGSRLPRGGIVEPTSTPSPRSFTMRPRAAGWSPWSLAQAHRVRRRPHRRFLGSCDPFRSMMRRPAARRARRLTRHLEERSLSFTLYSSITRSGADSPHCDAGRLPGEPRHAAADV